MRDYIDNLAPLNIVRMIDMKNGLDGIAASHFNNSRLLHTMLRVHDLQRSLDFYCRVLGMKLMRLEEYPDGQFTLAFIGYQEEEDASVIELTYNWGASDYKIGNAFGHIAVSVQDVYSVCTVLEDSGVTIIRNPGPMKHLSSSGEKPDVIAFIQDPDGYRIELIEAQRAFKTQSANIV